jgi:hypothetical protein
MRFIKSKKFTTQMGAADNGEGHVCDRQETHENFLNFSLNFVVDLKLLKKRNLTIKKKQ